MGGWNINKQMVFLYKDFHPRLSLVPKWCRWDGSGKPGEGQVAEKMSLSLFRFLLPSFASEKTAVLSPKVAPPPPGKFGELQRSAVPDTIHTIKPRNLERNKVGRWLGVKPPCFPLGNQINLWGFFGLKEGLRRKWGALSPMRGPEFISHSGWISPDEKFGQDWPWWKSDVAIQSQLSRDLCWTFWLPWGQFRSKVFLRLCICYHPTQWEFQTQFLPSLLCWLHYGGWKWIGHAKFVHWLSIFIEQVTVCQAWSEVLGLQQRKRQTKISAFMALIFWRGRQMLDT